MFSTHGRGLICRVVMSRPLPKSCSGPLVAGTGSRATAARACAAVAVIVVLAACGTPDKESGRLPTGSLRPESPPAPSAEDSGSPVRSEWLDLADRIVIDGSSTVFPITEAVVAEFEAAAPGVSVRLGVSGTGGGFRKFCRGRTDISDASRPIKDSEAELCGENGVRFVELPVAYDGLTVVVHKDNDFATCLTVDELRRVWRPEAEGAVNRWSQVRDGWPDEPLQLYGAGEDSGTFDYFTEAIVGEEGVSRKDFTASEDDYLIAQDVASDPSSLGFFGLAYAREYGDRLRVVAVSASAAATGQACVFPTDDAVRDGGYVPLSRPIFLYVSLRALERPAVEALLATYLASAARLVPEVGYVALPERAYELARNRLAARTTGSMFDGGSQVGVSVEHLLELEGSS